jgi:hypothetical protein
MTVPAAKRSAVRQAIASLLRLAHADAQDARTLAKAGGTRNASSLLNSAISRLIEAVVASEQGYAGPPEVRRIDARNPLKPSLLQLDAFLGAPSTLQQDGRLAAPPAAASLLEPLGLFTETLERFVQHCGVDLDGSGPADTAEPMRPAAAAPPPPPPAPAPKPRRTEPARRQAPSGRAAQSEALSRAAAASPKPASTSPSSPEAAPAAAPEPVIHAHRTGLSSGTFWSLVDHWPLPDLDATLAQLGLEPAKWLSTPLRPDPFRGAAPRDVIRRNRLQGLRDVSRYLTQMSLRLSLQQA